MIKRTMTAFARLRQVARDLAAMAARAVALPTDSLTPRLSWVGAAVLCFLVTVVVAAFALLALWNGIAGAHRTDVERRLHDLELVLGSVQAQFDGLARGLADEGMSSCGAGATGMLLHASLRSDHARRLFWRPPAGVEICSPGGESLPDPIASMLRGVRPEIGSSLRLDQAPDGSFFLVQSLADGGALAAEIAAARWQRTIGGVGVRFGDELRLHDWRGRLLFSLAPADEPDGSRVTALLANLQGALAATAFSSAYRLALVSGPSRQSLAAQTVKRLGFALGGSLLLTVFLVANVNRTLQDRFSIVRRLRRAIRRREIAPVLQPVIDAASGRCVGAEVLMRWRHPIRGLLPPAEFMSIAEQTGLINDMTWQLIERSRDRIEEIVRAEPGLVFSFNFGIQMLRDPGFVARLEKVFADTSIRPGNLAVELLERDAVDDRSIDMLARLRRRGYKVYIDDFGTGHSSLALLSQIGFDTLKIDREFVRSIDGDSMNRPVLDAIIDLSRQLGVRTIAEGVETQAQHHYLLAHGVGSIQGYLFARPMPIDEFALWLRANREHSGQTPRDGGRGDTPAAGGASSASAAAGRPEHSTAVATPEVTELVVPMLGPGALARMRRVARAVEIAVAPAARAPAQAGGGRTRSGAPVGAPTQPAWSRDALAWALPSSREPIGLLPV